MNRAGDFVKVLHGELAYRAYKPNSLPPVPSITMDDELLKLVGEAHNLLGKLDSMSKFIPDVDLFLGAYVRKEALLSSQIEGTQATLEDVLNPEIDVAQNLEVNDVINYVNALNYAINRMKDLPLCNRLLCETHKELLSGVRGQEKNPGEFRRSQNWIGASNSSLNNARYVPPTPEDMQQCMSDLEKFIHNSDLDILVTTALVHYQFETIHPFLDGNGRIGRMLAILMLLERGKLNAPVLYLSLFLKVNRVEYYDRLSEVRTKGNYEQWVKFFLLGIVETCRDSIDTIEKIHTVVSEDEQKLAEKSANVKKVFRYLKEHPIVSIGATAKELGLSFNTVSNALKTLIELDIVKVSNKARDRVFEYEKYLEILKAGTN